ncbi:MAG: T9SS type A sorting domain-containing protein [Saprospiraceae bacterium]|nr:T9SS type A sorting domain-containing protein [Saprospiraceae bacterium]
MDNGDKASFEEAKRQFQEYWRGKTPDKGKGFTPFNRWLYHRENHLLPDGTPAPAGANKEAFDFSAASLIGPATGNWANLGPNNSAGGYAGLGRINCVAFDPINVNTIYIGSAGGGVWKSTNGGTNWSPLTDNQGSLGASSILVEPTNPDIIYLATGDGDGRDSPSEGVLKSTDGGVNWSSTGLNWTRSDLRYIRKLQRHPSDPNIIFAATSVGIFKTADAGNSWTQTLSNVQFFDIENKPGDATTYYATGYISPGTDAFLYRTTDGGVNWSQIHTKTNSYRAAIAISPANPNFVGLLYARYDDDGFNGFYSSTNSGTTWTLKASTPNLLGWNANGGDAGGQGWYDLALAVDPANISVIYVGGVNTWKSTNGGGSWKVNTMWTSSGKTPIVHADKHALEFQNTTTLWQTNDGGVYKTANGGSVWTHLTNPMVISQMYRLGVAQTSSVVIAGLQDNGTKLRSTTGSWSDKIGGDGMDCAINPVNANYMYGELYYGDLKRSTNGGSTWTSIKPTSEASGWITPFGLAPSAPSTIYAGYKNIWKSTNNGTTWSAISAGNTINVRALAIAPSDANIVYYSTDADLSSGNRLFKTTTGTNSWTALTNPTNVGRISSIAIDNLNPNNVWVTISGYNAGEKVYVSTNGGSSWTNISGSLPNIPSNSLAFYNGSNGGVYLGMDIGVYYRDNSMTDWALFNAGLPNVEVADIEIQYALGKVRVASYGRGVWEFDMFKMNSIAGLKNGTQISKKQFENSTFSVYPNPVSTVINIEFYSSVEGRNNLMIMDMAGRMAHKTYSVDMIKGLNTISLSIADLPSGAYYIGDGKGKSTRFLKN